MGGGKKRLSTEVKKLGFGVGVERRWENYPNSVHSFLIKNVGKIMVPASKDRVAGETS